MLSTFRLVPHLSVHDVVDPPPPLPPQGFMVDTRCQAPPRDEAALNEEEGWEVAGPRKRRPSRSPPRPRRQVPADLVGLCFNCFIDNHVIAHAPLRLGASGVTSSTTRARTVGG